MNQEKDCFFSQNGEDFLLWNFFGKKTNGFYVDVGAFDGIHLSNSLSFEQKGWSGICIEPHPAYFRLCKHSRNRAICINAACVDNDSEDTVEFFSEELGLLSGTCCDREEDVKTRYKNRGLMFKGFNKIKVPAVTLNNTLVKYLPPGTEIDFISIDVEGTELEVLRGLDINMFRPRVIILEANSEKTKASIDDHLVKLNGYVEARCLGVNIFYVKNPKDADKLQSISVNCKIERNLHPMGEKYTLKPFIKGKVIH